jgi:NAD+-dependent protein deacetylase sirtuin 2
MSKYALISTFLILCFPEDKTVSSEGVGKESADEGSPDSDNSSELLEVIRAAAAARGIPFEWLLHEVQAEEENDIEYPFQSLPTSLEELAAFLSSPNCRSILILAGAGMSVAAGIPDFRSADGLYSTMNADLLSADEEQRRAMRLDPTVALDQHLFLKNPLPCLELNREFILGTREQRWKATIAHRFVELLHLKTNKLVRLYTQNIDGLEDQCTQLPRDKVINVHGSMDRAECATCHSEGDLEKFAEQVKTQIKDLSQRDSEAPEESTAIDCTVCCSNTMKPAIVLFRSSLPRIFFERVPEDTVGVDLLLVIGTSLRVAPANSIVWRVPKSTLRVLINREPEGLHLGMDFNSSESKRDYFAQGECEKVLLELMSHLGWLDDLAPLLETHQLPDTSAAILREHLRLGREPMMTTATTNAEAGNVEDTETA